MVLGPAGVDAASGATSADEAGATVAGAAAGEQIAAWTLAINHGLNIRAFSDMIVPYPTYMEIGKRAAVTFLTPRLTTSWIRRLLNLLRRFG
jgi:hypothetical protein